MDTATAAHTATTLASTPPWGDGPPPFAPLGAIMFCLLFALLLGALLFTFLHKRNNGAPPWVRQTRPEDEARRTLADRFARGDITVEEFMERASALNWTPGKDQGHGRR